MASALAKSSFVISNVGARGHTTPSRVTVPVVCPARRRRSHAVCMSQAERGGGNNLNVNGKQPTSPVAWAEMQKVLKETGMKVVSPQEVEPMQERGAIVIDIRPAKDYDEYYIPDAVNVPFYRPIEGWSGKQAARRIAYAFFGVFNGTEYNPDFVKEVEEVAQKDSEILVVCNLGSKPEQTTGDAEKFGTSKSQTRSLMAAYELASCGYTNLSVLRGGFSGWINSDRDVCSNVHDMSESDSETA